MHSEKIILSISKHIALVCIAVSRLKVYPWKKVREHLLCYEGKLWTKFLLQFNYVLTKLFNLSKFVVYKLASA